MENTIAKASHAEFGSRSAFQRQRILRCVPSQLDRVQDKENLKMMMNLLRDKSPNIQYEAFHVFKVRMVLFCFANNCLVSFRCVSFFRGMNVSFRE